MGFFSDSQKQQLGYYREPLSFELKAKNFDEYAAEDGHLHLHISERASSVSCLKMSSYFYLILSESSFAVILDTQKSFAWQFISGHPCCEFYSAERPAVSPMVPADLLLSHTFWLNAAPDLVFSLCLTDRDHVSINQQPPVPCQAVRVDENLYFLWLSDPQENLLLLCDMNTVRCQGCLFSSGQPVLFSAYGGFQFRNRADYQDRVFGQNIFNPVSSLPSPGGLHHYIYPPTTEVEGMYLDFFLDGFGPLHICFQGNVRLLWEDNHGSTERSCSTIKVDDDTYLTLVPFFDHQPTTLFSIIWSLCDASVTMICSTIGENLQYPRLVRSVPYFGTRTNTDTGLASYKPGFTEKLVGKRILWQYTPLDTVLHIFPSKSRQRLGQNHYILSPDATPQARKSYDDHVKARIYYPFYEEPAFYLQLSENLFLYSVIEENSYRLVPGSLGGGELLVVLDIRRECYAGRTFGLDPNGKPQFDQVGAPGMFTTIKDETDRYPCPYYTFPSLS